VDTDVGEAIVRGRLAALRLTGAKAATPEDVVQWLGAVQAQDFGPAKWAVGQRTQGATDAQLDRAYAEGRILRTHVLRPTWHFVLPADIRMLLAATATRIQARNAFRHRQLGLDAATLGRGRDLLAGALAGGRHLTRGETAALLTRSGIAVDGQRLAYIMMDAELNAVICSGVPRGAQHTYALLDERVPPVPAPSRETAVADLALRYFTSHGPATAKDFAAWASLTLADVEPALTAAGPRLRREVMDQLVFWSAPAPAAPPLPSPTVHLLQGYDEYIMGYSETKRVLARPGSSWSPGTPPVFALVVLLDGRVAGFWRRTVATRSVTVTVALLDPFGDEQAAALEAEAVRYGEFLGLSARIEIRLHR
jgi:hypothetical protein